MDGLPSRKKFNRTQLFRRSKRFNILVFPVFYFTHTCLLVNQRNSENPSSCFMERVFLERALTIAEITT